MVRSGQTTIDFGAFPGVTDVTATVTGQDDIAAGATVEAFIMPTATVDHSADEHIVDSPASIAGNVSAGVGFTIYGITNTNQLVYGKWTVGWRWSVGGTGDVAVTMADGTTALFASVPAGTILPIQVQQVLSTNTSATFMVGLY
jgi:hypothetical protein